MAESLWGDEEKTTPVRPYTLVELFAGAGGLALGLEQAGFHSVLLSEKNNLCLPCPNGCGSLQPVTWEAWAWVLRAEAHKYHSAFLEAEKRWTQRDDGDGVKYDDIIKAIEDVRGVVEGPSYKEPEA